MGQDLFNNISNDYVYPDLPPCPGSSDSETFEVLPGEQVGIVSGSEIVAAMNLADISQPVTGWTQQTKVLQSGEVTFIAGLEKGLSYQEQVFLFDASGDIYNPSADQSYYLGVDLSLNYYNNFRHYDVNIHAEGNYANGITIANALDIAFADRGILITTNYDASGFTFVGSMVGYQIDITNVDASLFLYDNSTNEILTYDRTTSIPAFKYYNTAMLGYVLKVTYPSTTVEDCDKYVEINHVPDTLTYYEAVDVSQFVSPAAWETSIFYAPTGSNVDVSVFIWPAYWEPSTFYTVDGSVIDVSVFISPEIWEPSTFYTAGAQLVDVSVYTVASTWEPSTFYQDPSGLIPIDVSVFKTEAIWITEQHWIGSGAAEDVSVFISPAVWETSTYFIEQTKTVDVGLSGKNLYSNDVMSAGEYLDYVQSNGKWEKVGILRVWLTAPDPTDSNIKNLIPGFYVFNPQTFSVKLDYMIIA